MSSKTAMMKFNKGNPITFESEGLRMTFSQNSKLAVSELKSTIKTISVISKMTSDIIVLYIMNSILGRPLELPFGLKGPTKSTAKLAKAISIESIKEKFR
eukprot:GFUD01083345.1.p2 GENE.GFUD01083345.1~~GFUD01083345.1.p2  ORF type:complete len:100 (-),score=26.10 GFUD01083345.1:111-410(-)